MNAPSRNRLRLPCLLGLLLAAGCDRQRSTTAREPASLRPAQRRLLDYGAARFDPQAGLLQVEQTSPGLHTRIPPGQPVHPIRESLFFALALLQRQGPGDVPRAVGILQRTLPLQETDPHSPTYGTWPWYLEEPLDEMPLVDLNWADFCGMLLAHVLVEHGDDLPPRVRSSVRNAVRHAAASVRARDVQPSYTNVAVLGGGFCAVAGELFEDRELLAYGRERLESVVEHTARQGSFTEYNSPPYTKVVIAECERILQLVRDERTRAAAESLRRTGWSIAAGSFHVGTQQWAGPHSRTSRIRLRRSTVAFLEERTGVDIRTHPTMRDEPPRGYAVVAPLPCPPEFVSHYRTPVPDPATRRQTYVHGDGETPPLVGTTWFAPHACLGSVNRSALWRQRKPLVAYWRTEDDPAIAFRVRFLHDGHDFASMELHTDQQGPRVLCAFRALRDAGSRHARRDRPPDGAFEARDFRLRCELHGAGVQGRNLGEGRFELTAGGRRIVIHTRKSTFAERPVRWELQRTNDVVSLDGICHQGETERFDFSAGLPVDLVLGLELLPTGAPVAAAPPAGDGDRVSWRPRTGDTLELVVP